MPKRPQWSTARRSTRQRLRLIAGAVAAVLAAETAVVVATTGQAVALGSQQPPARAAAADAAPKGPAEAQDEASARLLARLQKRRIEVLSARTETSATYVLPDGQMQTAVYAAPVRVKKDGVWQDINTTLADAGADLRPRTATADITVSDGGDRKLASVGRGGRGFAMGWEKNLPAPKLKGDTAAYDLGGGETLTVTALPQGFSQNVHLAKAPTAPVSYRIPVEAKGLKLSQAPSGRLLLKDSAGKLVAEAPAPMMWDSSKDPRSGESKHLARVPVKIETAKNGKQTLVLSPDPKYFTKDLTYPVTVDPTSTLAASTDTWVATNYPDSQVSSAELKSGTYDGGTTKARAYLKFDVSAFKGKRINDTNLGLYSYYSSTCSTSGSGTQVRRITGDWSSSAITWGAQPATTDAGAVTSTAAKGYNSTCPAGTVDFDIDAIVQAWADGQPNYGLQVKGAGETDSTTWRRYRSANYVSGDHAQEPHLTVTYDSYPGSPTATAISPSAVNAYNGIRYVTSVTPTLSAKVTDPDGATVRAQFEITPDPAYNETTYTYTGTSAAVASGSNATLTVPTTNKLPSGPKLRYRVRGYDGTFYGPWSAYMPFGVNTAKPAAPAISCQTYDKDTWTARASGPVTCTLDTASTDGQGYYWGLDDTNLPHRVDDTVDGTGGDALTISLDPADGWHTLRAKTVDSGGNLSTDVTSYSFGVGADGAAVISPADGDDTARRVSLRAKGKAEYTGVTYEYRRGETDSWKTVPTAQVTTTTGGAVSWPAQVTSGTAPPLVWDAATSLAEDGVLELRAVFDSGTAARYHSQVVEVTLDRQAGNAPSLEVGPGTVNAQTGDFTFTDTDAEVFGLSAERSHSSRRPVAQEVQEGQAAIFGPNWSSGVGAEDAGTDWTVLRRTSATSVEILDSTGVATAFTATSGGGWKAESGSEDLTLTGSPTTSFTLKDTSGTVSVFRKVDAAAATWTLATTALSVDDSTTTVVSEKVTAGGAVQSRPKYLIGASPAVDAATCQADPATNGCRVLEYVYASSTTATSTAFGSYTGQVAQLKLWATSPGASAATAETVAQYAYDASGRLREVWDPRISPALKTAYAYDSAGRLTTLTEPGELPWTLTYGKAGTAVTAGEGMLLSASRPTLKQGSAAETDGGKAVTTVVYQVPVSGSGAPYQLDAAAVAVWGQTDAPVDATAVFPPDQVPASHVGTSLTADAYKRATIVYADASGREVNTAQPGGHIDSVDYNQYGSEERSLTPGNRALAVGATDAAKAELTRLGIVDATVAERAEQLSTRTVYSADGRRETEEFGPLHLVTLERALSGGTAAGTLPAGTEVPARTHTVNTYDEGRPADAAVQDLVTTAVTGASVKGYATDADRRTTVTGYDWASGRPTRSVVDPGGLAITTTTAYDAAGRKIRETSGRSNGTDALTTVTEYWSATGTGACAGKPAWAGLVCRTSPAGTITGGGSHPAERVTKTYGYDRWGNVSTATETANGATRTTTVTTDAAGRQIKSAVTGDAGTPVPEATTVYHQQTGEVASQTAAGATVAYGYDALGRRISTTDGTGNTVTTAYDALDRPVQVSDSAPSTTTYAYDTAVEPRGLATKVTDSVAGTFAGTYDADGELATESLPGAVTLTVDRDPAGNTTARTYAAADGTTLLSDTTGHTAHQQQAGHHQSDGTATSTAYTYDAAGRLVTAKDTADALCTRRSYAFDANSNRTGLTTADCSEGGTGSTSTTHTYDSADRIVDSGYAYDAFGRTTATPAGGRLTYYANDLVHSETVGDRRQTWNLDATGRMAAWTVETKGTDGTWTRTESKTHHFGTGDNPTWTVEDAQGTITRYVNGLSGLLTATTGRTGGLVLQLVNLHGDVSVQLPADATQAPVVLRTDEYGNRAEGATTARYGWVGGHQRSSETLSGSTLMGVRLYAPATGRFLQTDPVPGGSLSAYAYPGDPVNSQDLDGQRWKKKKVWHVKKKKAKKLARAIKAGARLASAFGRIGLTMPAFWAKIAGLALEAIGGAMRWFATEIQLKNAMPKSKGVKITVGIWQKSGFWKWVMYPRIKVNRWKK
ncbi:DNRLRE domain-containing protein [Streptomyces sp. NPDC093600]|uniref:DNRLRE domain-containing protein n=1 Tax=Streptomyces sp. NPDC093600 TaxID=3366047 RepID=UPI00382B39E7